MTDLVGVDIFRATVGLTCYAPGNTFSSAVDEKGKFFWKRKYITGVTIEQLAMIAQLRHLKRLSLEANPIDDAGVAEIVKLNRLESLNLSHTAITDDAIATLMIAPSLRELNISYTDITDDAIESLARCDCLEQLNIKATQLSGVRIDWLEQQLPMCKIAR